MGSGDSRRGKKKEGTGLLQAWSRAGQSASGTAILVAIIGGLLVGYILFLPPAEREQLLFGDGSGGGYSGGYGGGSGGGVLTQYGPVLIMTETPGTLRLQKSPTAEHSIPSTTIFTALQTQELKTVDSVIIKSGVFARRKLDLDFQLDQGIRNLLLSFNVDQAGEAPLRVLVNGKLLFERQIRERSPSPISIPAEYLVRGENHVVLETSDVGFAFWKPNAYLLHSVLLSADVFDDSASHASQTFSIGQNELDTFESAQLQLVPQCDPRTAGRLIVQLNEKLLFAQDNSTRVIPNVLYSGYPDCGVLFKTDVAKEYLRAGENNVLFASQDGQYVIDRIKLIVKLKQQDYPIYYFNLPREMYDSLELGRGQLSVTLTFTDYRIEKSGEIVLNGFVQSFTTKEYAYQAVIDPGVLTPGPNTIQIMPHIDKVDIAEVKIEIV